MGLCGTLSHSCAWIIYGNKLFILNRFKDVKISVTCFSDEIIAATRKRWPQLLNRGICLMQDSFTVIRVNNFQEVSKWWFNGGWPLNTGWLYLVIQIIIFNFFAFTGCSSKGVFSTRFQRNCLPCVPGSV